MLEDEGYGIGCSVSLFRLGAGPLSEEEAAEVLAGGGDIYAEATLDGECVAHVRLSTGSSGDCVWGEAVGEARMSAGGAAELALVRCMDALLAGVRKRYSRPAEPKGE